MAEKQLQSTVAAAAFQKQWFGDLRRRVFEERRPYALIQADVPFELFDLLEIPAVSNQWWSSLVAGVPVDAPAIHAAIEAEGALVVAELSPFGGCGTDADVEIADDPYAALVNHYGRESIDARLPVTALMHKLDELLDGAQAVVLSLPQDDGSFGWDYPRVRELLARRSIPHVVLSGDPTFGAAAADRDRIRSLLGSAATRPGARCG